MTFEVGKAYRLRFEDAPGYEGSHSEEESEYSGVCTYIKYDGVHPEYVVLECDDGECVEAFLRMWTPHNRFMWWGEDLTWYISAAEEIPMSDLVTIQ